MPSIWDVLAKIVAAGNTAVAASGTGIPLHGIVYDTGTVTVTSGSTAVSSAGGANFTSTHAAYAAAGILYLFTAGNHLYKVDSVSAAGESMVLVTPGYATETDVAYNLHLLYDCKQMVFHVPSGNTGGIWIGDYTVDKTAMNGLYISKGTSLSLDVSGLIDFWIDADTNADTISWLLLT